MNVEAARVAAFNAVSAAAATITPVPPIDWPNRNLIDYSKQVDPYLGVDFIVGRSLQKSLGTADRLVRYFGQISIIVCIKEGGGTATPTVMLDKLILGLGMKSFSGLNTEAATPLRPVLEKGWHVQPLVVPCWFDDVL